jgi:hypothetical protein
VQPTSRESEQDQLIDIGLAINEVESSTTAIVRTLTKDFGWDNDGFAKFDKLRTNGMYS